MLLRRAGLHLVVGALLLASPALAQTFGQNKIQYHDFQWNHLTSPHFDVYYYQGERRLAEDAAAIAERANVLLSRDLDHRLSRRVPIILYRSHNDFAQTNVTNELLDEATGGFTESLKNRVVIPFTGSYEELRHVLVHELTHAFQFDILYGGPLQSFLAVNRPIDVPLWFGEGMAEFESLGMEPGCEQFMRDGVIHGYLIPLQYEPGGYLVYKQGQAAMAYILKRYGREKYTELLHRLRTYRDMDRVMQRTLGLTIEKFNTEWIKDLKKTYWPTVATLDDPEKFARRLTDHDRDRSYLNVSPAISPAGDKVVYLSDRKIYTDLYLMSAIDGKILKRLVRGSHSSQFENIPSFRSSIGWSPDGGRVAFVAKSGELDEIYIYDLARDDVVQELKFQFDAVAYPAFSPDGKTLAFEGLKEGINDIYLVDLATRSLRRMTEDAFDEKDLTFAPDGSLTFASDRHDPVEREPIHGPGRAGTYGIYSLDPGTGAVRELLFSGNNDAGPAWSPDGRRLAFISQRNHSQDLFLFTPADSTVAQVTQVIGGIYNVSWSRSGDRLVFSALNNGGWDVFASREPLSADSTLSLLKKDNPGEFFRWQDFALRNPEPFVHPAPFRSSAKAALPDSAPGASGPGHLAAADSADTVGARLDAGRAPHTPAAPDSLAKGGAGQFPEAFSVRTGTPRSLLAKSAADSVFKPDTLRPRVIPVTPEDSVRAEAFADTASRLPAVAYHAHFAPDYLTGGFQYNTLFGFGGSTQLAVSDFLGDERFFLATDLFTSSLDETNFLALYNYLPKRTDYAFGLYHFKNYYFSRITGLGEQFSEARFFSERNFGLIGEMSYPFSKFQRLDADLSLQVVKRNDLNYDSAGIFFTESDTTNLVAAPSMSLTNDNVIYGRFGPIDGNRWVLSGTQAVPLGRESLSYTTLSLDYRAYKHLGSGYSFAFRTLGIRSSGRNPQTFFLGGATTLRGYDTFDPSTTDPQDVLSGRNAVLSSVEFRFPFITHLGFSAPLPISFFNIEGVLFSDVGAAWDSRLRVFSNDGGLHLVDPRASFGVGVRAAFLYFLMHLDVAWPTQATSTNPEKQPRWHFSIGPEF